MHSNSQYGMWSPFFHMLAIPYAPILCSSYRFRSIAMRLLSVASSFRAYIPNTFSGRKYYATINTALANGNSNIRFSCSPKIPYRCFGFRYEYLSFDTSIHRYFRAVQHAQHSPVNTVPLSIHIAHTNQRSMKQSLLQYLPQQVVCRCISNLFM